jgi:hypothetical protein
MLFVVVPSLWTSRKIAEPWNPDAHAVLVDHVGVPLIAPPGGVSLTVAELVPWAALAALAAHPPRSVPLAPATTSPPSHFVKWPFLLPNMSFAPRVLSRHAGPSAFIES